jgi:hypothetical protein
VLATIYRKTKAYPFYRVCAYVAGKRRLSSYPTYSEAKTAAEKLVKDLAKGSQAAALTAEQSRDALCAFETLQGFFAETGKRISLHSAVSQFCDNARKLNGTTFAEAIDGYLNSVATLKRIDVGQAIDLFIEHRKAKTVARDGKRPQLSPDHRYNTALWLTQFAKAFPGNAVNDLTKQHLDLFMRKFAKAPLEKLRHLKSWPASFGDFLRSVVPGSSSDQKRKHFCDYLEWKISISPRIMIDDGESPQVALIRWLTDYQQAKFSQASYQIIALEFRKYWARRKAKAKRQAGLAGASAQGRARASNEPCCGINGEGNHMRTQKKACQPNQRRPRLP